MSASIFAAIVLSGMTGGSLGSAKRPPSGPVKR